MRTTATAWGGGFTTPLIVRSSCAPTRPWQTLVDIAWAVFGKCNESIVQSSSWTVFKRGREDVPLVFEFKMRRPLGLFAHTALHRRWQTWKCDPLSGRFSPTFLPSGSSSPASESHASDCCFCRAHLAARDSPDGARHDWSDTRQQPW